MSRALASALVGLEPAFAEEAAAVADLFERPDAAGLPPRLSALRRSATARAWAEGVRTWNARAADRVAFLADLRADPARLRIARGLLAADFRDAVLPRLDAQGALFPGGLLLAGAVLSGPLLLDGAELGGALAAGTVRVAGEVSAENACFAGPVRLSGAALEGRVRFGFAVLERDLEADGTLFGHELWLRHATVPGLLMRNATLKGDASLGACAYRRPVRLDGTRFCDTLSLEGAVFHDELSLDRCVLEGRLRLTGARLDGPLSAVGTRFGGTVTPPLSEVAASRPAPHAMLDRLRGTFGGDGTTD